MEYNKLVNKNTKLNIRDGQSTVKPKLLSKNVKHLKIDYPLLINKTNIFV